MPLNLPTLPELLASAKTRLRARLGVGPVLPRGPLDAIANLVASSRHALGGYLEWVSRQPFVDTCEAEQLDRHGSLLGVARKAATYSKGSVVLQGATDGTVLPAGTTFVRGDGRAYTVDSASTVVAGVVMVNVTASVAGANGDCETSTALTMSTTIAGLPSEGSVASPGIQGGADQESDESYRARLIAHKRTPPATGTADDYVRWALEVAGVTRAWCIPGNQGLGTVGVTFVRDDDVGGILPSSAEVADVQAYIDTRKPVTASVLVFAPSVISQAFTLSVSPNTAEVQTSVTEALRQLLIREGGPGTTIPISHVRAAISNAPEEFDHVLSSPTADLVYAAGQVPELGTVTFT